MAENKYVTLSNAKNSYIRRPKKGDMIAGRSFFVLPGLFILLLSSCNNGVLYQKYVSLPDKVWDVKNPLIFKVEVSDTMNYYNIFVNVRNEDNYTYSNLYLFINITSPAHTTEKDTMECMLADPNTGKWFGRGLGDIWDNKILFKRNVRFPRKGEYLFSYTQAMRTDKLSMIRDAGLSIEKVGAPRN